MEYGHIPVLLAEVLKQLKLHRGSTVIDCTLGGAGHAGAALDLVTPEGFLLGIDKDDAAINVARECLARFSQQIKLVRDDFTNIDWIVPQAGLNVVDAILFDLGASSFQLDNPKRGFSYQLEGLLDMRMDRRVQLTAADVVNKYSQRELTRVLKEYGEEKWASRIARFILEARKRKPLATTSDLVKVIKDAIPASARRLKHPAKKTFQALRIEVNQELAHLEKAIRDSVKWLKSGGRLAVISYHSLEDRVVKKTLEDLAKGCICPPSLPVCRCGERPVLKILTKKPIRPGEEEIKANRRSRSAKLRVAEKI